jgi:hypothetical protein
MHTCFIAVLIFQSKLGGGVRKISTFMGGGHKKFAFSLVGESKKF